MRIWIAIWVGSTLICRWIAAWLLQGLALRLLAVLLVAGFLRGLAVLAETTAAAAGLWLLAAVVLGLAAPDPTKPQKAPDCDPEKTDEEPEGPGVPEMVAAMHRLADPHVHLSALAQELGFGKDNTAPVHALLKEAGVPSKAVRMGGKSSTGVDRSHFPPLPHPATDASDDVVAAGQSNNNNAEGPPVVEKREGMTIIRAFAERARHHTVTRRT